MIFATGTFKGKPCDLTPVSVHDVINEFNVPFNGKSMVEFTLDKSLVKFDQLNKVEKYRQRAGKGNTIQGRDSRNNSVSLLFSYSAPRKDKNGLIVSEPKHYFYEGKDFHVPANRLEEAVFFYLHPNCAQSPFFDGRAEWSLVDREANAKKEYDAMLNITSLVSEIGAEKDYQKLKRIALGIKLTVNGQSITIPQNRIGSLDEVKVQLSNLAIKHPEQFSLAYRDGNMLLAGTVKDAINSGLLILKGVGGGMSKWYWTIGDRSELCTVNNGVDSFAALLNAVQNRETFMAFINMVDGNSNQITAPIASLLNGESSIKDPKDMTGAELASEALKAGVVEFNREKSIFQVIGPDGEPELQGLHKVENPAKRISELSDALEGKGIKRNRVVKALKGERSEEEPKTEE